MVGLPFRTHYDFERKILEGKKTQTIRKYTAKRWKELQNCRDLQLYKHWRTPKVELIARAKLAGLFFCQIETMLNEDEKDWPPTDEDDGWIGVAVDPEKLGFSHFRLMVDWEPLKHYWKVEEDNLGSRGFTWRDLEVHEITSKEGREIVKLDGLTPEEFILFFTKEHNLYEDFFIGIRWNYPVIPPLQEKSLLECFV
ncbi:MAG: hypothetical protein ACFFD4_08110 [Candidatus Odinarchaeota archaeon]